MEPVYSSVIGVARGVFAMQGLKFTVLGDDNVPRTGGAVMTINHTGYFDFAYAGLAAQKSDRLVRFMAKDGVFSHPVSGPLMRGMHHIPVDRDRRAGVVCRPRSRRCGPARSSASSPRRRSPAPSSSRSSRPARRGWRIEAGVPILPVVIWGSQRVWTKGHPKRLGRTNVPILINVGEPIPVAPDADAEAVTGQYKAVMADLLDVARAAYEPLTGPDLKYLPASLGGTAPTLAEATRLDEADTADRQRRADERRGFSTD